MNSETNPILWSPSDDKVTGSNMYDFTQWVSQQYSQEFADYEALHQWSVANPEDFWTAIWDYCGVIASERGEIALESATPMIEARFFPQARLNFAENLLRGANDTPDSDALVFRGEDKVSRRLSFAELRDQASSIEQCLLAAGVDEGDRVAAMIPNMPEAVIGMLSTSSLGAVWASCSPEFGLEGLLDRFGQIEPTVLIICDGYFYNGKVIDVREKALALATAIPSLKQVICVSYAGLDLGTETVGDVPVVSWDTALQDYAPQAMRFRQMPFDHPLYILFSSGTTGKPKCIVHGAGGTLLQHLKEHALHSDIRAGDRVFYFTTCTWMMWNWLVSALAVKATVLLYDGSPFYPSKTTVLDYLQDEKATFFGTSAKYIDELKKAELKPADTHDLSTVRTIASTGSPLMPDSYEYVYSHIKSDVCLASIAGGTDIISCFVLGNPTLPVYRGEIQCKGLGMAMQAWDDDGNPAADNKGELVCSVAFPSMPVCFWNDEDNARYTAAYFEKFPGYWAHGDLAEFTANGGVIIHGRSDATLNPGGVRIGTAEIYRQVEIFPEVKEAMAIGQQFDGDVRVILFVVMKAGMTLDEDFVKTLKQAIRKGASPRHVPAKILQVAELPRTASGKIVELAVRDVVHGREVKNKTALANPEALELFKDLPELQD
ncbi:acetoacetate--CoA ligase [Leucothrix pacifica]|uniref:Acetoacetate--CoA ligase n=1 Tax=Leucothrix pacifica TaxID=1247513 RepID=A0A317C8M9_9GAMM|nr:acetoacetate--CoA ligase [Leucothrix pacifica]PWQ95025.1 acetoacetate--CoA ligase [Leucothrix pacifica]